MIIINELLQRLNTPFFVYFFNIITLLGSTIGIIVFYLIISFSCNHKISGCYLLFIVLFFPIIYTLKYILKVPRPFTTGLVLNLDWQLLGKLNPSRSFPSGHSYVISFSIFYIVFNLKLHVSEKILCYIVLFLVLLSRLYLGVHFILDVITGATIGFDINYIIFYIKREKKLKQSKNRQLL